MFTVLGLYKKSAMSNGNSVCIFKAANESSAKLRKKLNISNTIQPILAKSTQMIPVCLAIFILVTEDLGNIRQGQNVLNGSILKCIYL